MPDAGPLLASAHAELAKQLAAVPKGKQGAALVVFDTDGTAAVGFATRLGDDWAIGGDLVVPLRDVSKATGQIIVAGSW